MGMPPLHEYCVHLLPQRLKRSLAFTKTTVTASNAWPEVHRGGAVPGAAEPNGLALDRTTAELDERRGPADWSRPARCVDLDQGAG